MCVVREMGMFRIFAHVPQRPKTGKKKHTERASVSPFGTHKRRNRDAEDGGST